MHGTALKESIKQAPEDSDLFTTRATLQVLAAAKQESTYTQLEAARDLWGAVPKSDSPLEHFVDMALVALGKMSAPLFTLLKSKYARSLARDDTLQELVGRIEGVWFLTGTQPNLGDMLGSMFGGQR